jgi:hypothetical protein
VLQDSLQECKRLKVNKQTLWKGNYRNITPVKRAIPLSVAFSKKELEAVRVSLMTPTSSASVSALGNQLARFWDRLFPITKNLVHSGITADERRQ